MAHIYAVNGILPVVHASAYLSASATIIGDVIIGENCYVGPSACLRGDFGRIVLRDGCNVQDCCVLHGGPEHDTVVRENAIVGHGAVLHGCEIGANAMIGINSVVLDGATVGPQAVVGAMSFVPLGESVPPQALVIGIPVRFVRTLTESELKYLSDGERAYRDLTGHRMRRVGAPLRSATEERLGQRNRHFGGS